MTFDSIFEVKKKNDKYVFLYCDMSKKHELLEKYFEYFFSEEAMYNHFNYLYNVPFKPDKRTYIHLYYELKKFIDDYNVFDGLVVNNESIKGIESELVDEGLVEKEDDKFKYRSDKAGKIGEYFFSVLLEKFFKLHCIIPKSRLSTDYNMNVYGIDVLYLNEEDNSLYFGESKFTKNIHNGIVQINKSLKTYEKQISDEFELVLNSWDARSSIYRIHEIFGDNISLSIKFKDFIDKAEIRDIYIPLFIAHGTEKDSDTILEVLDEIIVNQIFDLNTKFIIISLPIIDKDEFMKDVTARINKRMGDYLNEK